MKINYEIIQGNGKIMKERTYIISKRRVYIAGFLISLIFGLISPITGLICSVIIGAGKEVVWDKLMKKGCFEVLDFVATCVGGVIGYLILML